MKPISVHYTAVKLHRGAGRLWIESQRLFDAGFAPATKYTACLTPAGLELLVDPDGERKVSKRTRNGKITPIVDVTNAAILDTFGEKTRIRIELHHERILFSVHHEDDDKNDRERKAKNAKTIRTGSGCTGGGIASAAMADISKPTALKFAIEREAQYLECAIQNNPSVTSETVTIQGSLEEVESKDIQQVDVLQVSLPCTGHSSAGKAKNGNATAEEHATDATAVVGFLSLLKYANPAAVILENVPACATSATYTLIRAELNRRGYTVQETVLDASHAGSIENRRRHWLVAMSSGLPQPVLDFDEITPEGSLGDILEEVPEESWRTFDYLDAKEAKDMSAGKGFRRQLVTEDSTQIGCIGRDYAKIRSTEPHLIREDGMQRLLTPTEHARAKGIPAHLVAGMSKTKAHEILGQSILWNHAKLIMQRVADCLGPQAALV